MRKVLILTAGYGEGHNTAARGLKEAFDELGGAGASVLDLCEPALGSLYQRSRQGYLRMVHGTPWLWEFLYAVLHRFPKLLGNAHRLIRPLAGELVRELKQLRPAAVVSVYPVYGYLVRAAAQEAGLPDLKNFVLLTDSISINALWYKCDADAFLTPNEDTAAVLRAGGVEPEKIIVTGFPVSPRFARSSAQRPVPGTTAKPRILLMVNGGPTRTIPLVERLLRELDITLTVAVGKEERLGDELRNLAARMGKPLTVVGWVENLPALLQSHHVLIGKAGGATVQEALAAHTPMLVTHILPGQETGNARLLLQYGCGAHVPTSEAVIQVLKQLFQNDAGPWHRMHRNCINLGRPEAALTAARWILREVLPSPPAKGLEGIRPDKARGDSFET
jgi:processive 1,2-diacylglycerol beta-glucosyltransferase